MRDAFRSTSDDLRFRLWRFVQARRSAARLRARAPAAGGAVRAQSQIVPQQTVAGRAMVFVVGIMSFLACITVGAVTLVGDASRDWQNDIAREVTIQVRPLEEVDTDAEADKALAFARQTAGVASVRLLDQAENARLLEPWLGTGLDMEELPLPRLIVLELADPEGADLAGLGERLRTGVRGATLDDHRAWTDRLRTMAGATVVVGISILGLVFTATVLCVVFATRGAMAGNRDIVSVLHFVGAEDRFIAAEFQRHFLLLGLKGGLVGAVGAVLLFAVLSFVLSNALSTPEGDQVAVLFGRFAVGPTGYFGALGVAFLIAVLTAVTTRITVFRYLAEVE